ncbi:MAG: hypothetical protein WCD79_20260 [Chthoniobacteraceae bacterium]
MRFLATMALTLAAGILVASGIAWLLELVWPAASGPVFLVLAALWIWFGWSQMKKRNDE